MKWMTGLSKGRDCGGLYAIYLDGRLSYIGNSVRLSKRLGSHGLLVAARCGLWKGMPFTNMKVKVRPIACELQTAVLESALIARLRPPGNIAGVVGKPRMIIVMKKERMNPSFRSFVKDIGGQSKVATLLGLSRGHVSLLFNGKRRVTVELAERIEIATQGRYSRELLVFGARAGKSTAAKSAA